MIIETECTCGQKVIILSGDDTIFQTRRDGKQAIYSWDEKGVCIFRCEGCMEPLHETVKEFNYG